MPKDKYGIELIGKRTDVPFLPTAPRTDEGNLTNAVKAEFGRGAVDVGSADRGQNDDQTDAVDVVANIMHWVEREGFDPELVLERAAGHFYAERVAEPKFGEVELEPFRIDPGTESYPDDVTTLAVLPDGALFEDAEGRLFNVVSQGPTQGATEIVDDDEVHDYFDCSMRVRLHERD